MTADEGRLSWRPSSLVKRLEGSSGDGVVSITTGPASDGRNLPADQGAVLAVSPLRLPRTRRATSANGPTITAM